MADKFDIDHIAFIGRTFREYCDIFGLDEGILKRGPILDCPAGAASFAAEARAMGLDATACDTLYGLPLTALVEKGMNDIALTYDKIDAVSHQYIWEYYKDRDEIMANREKALGVFSSDFPSGSRQGRYLHATLPVLPFEDGRFSLVLSGNLLFLYSDRLDYDFHLASVRELLRVARGEVRIFPLQGLDAGPSGFVETIMAALESEGVRVEMPETGFEFQRGANKVMRLTKGGIA